MSEQPLRLGGMALRNGLLVHGPTAWAAAVRDDSGHVVTASGPKPGLPDVVGRIPLARGVLRLGELVALLPVVRRRLPEARLPFEDSRVLASVALSIGAAAALRAKVSPARAEAIAAFAGLVPSAMALRSRTLAGYHGAEHKAIGAYETGGAAVDASKEHERCGSHLIGPLVLASTAANLLASRAPEESRQKARAAGSLAAVGIAVEVFAWMDRNRSSRLSRLLARPGHLLQRFGSTAEPTGDQLDVATRALDELLRVERAASSR